MPLGAALVGICSKLALHRPARGENLADFPTERDVHIPFKAILGKILRGRQKIWDSVESGVVLVEFK